MILVDGEKYACEQCIRGHRSSTCKHIRRPLVLVRSRGRPSTDSFQRIAIFAEEIKDENEKKETKSKHESNSMHAKFVSDICTNNEADKTQNIKSSCCSKKLNSRVIKSEFPTPSIKSEFSVPFSQIQPEKSLCVKDGVPEPEIKNKSCSCCLSTSSKEGCKKKNSSIFILKAAKRQVYNVEKDSLRLLDPVVEIPNSKVGLDIIQKVSKQKKMHSCRNKKIKEDLLHALKSLDELESNGSCCSNVDVIGNGSLPLDSPLHQYSMPVSIPINNIDTSSLENIALQNQTQNHIVQPNNNNHNQNYTNEIQSNKNKQNQGILYGNDNNNISSSSEKLSNIPQNNNVIQHPNSILYDLYIADSCTVPGSCLCEPDKCLCPDCTEHGRFKGSNLSVKQQFEQFQFPVDGSPSPNLSNSNGNHKLVRPYGKVEIQSSIPQFEQTFLKLLNDESNNSTNINKEVTVSESTNISDCYCEADRCCCFNCVEHGIINGIRIRDGSSILDNQLPYEIQLTNPEFPIYEISPSSTLSTPTGLPVTESQNMINNQLDSNHINPSDKERWLENHHSQQFIPANQQHSPFPNTNEMTNSNDQLPYKVGYKTNGNESILPVADDQILSLLMNHHHITGSNNVFEGQNNNTVFTNNDSADRFDSNVNATGPNSYSSGFRN